MRSAYPSHSGVNSQHELGGEGGVYNHLNKHKNLHFDSA